MPDGRTVSVVVVDADEFENILEQSASLFATYGVNMEKLRISGNLLAGHSGPTAWLYEKYQVPDNHMISIIVRGMARRIMASMNNEPVESGDGKTVMHQATHEHMEAIRKKLDNELSDREKKELEELTDLAHHKVAPNGVLVDDLLLAKLPPFWERLKNSLVNLHGDKGADTEEIIDQARLSLERVWLVNSREARAEWDPRGYLWRLIGMIMHAHRNGLTGHSKN